MITLKDIKVGSQALTSYSYEEHNGNLSQTPYGNGQKLIPSYDTLGRITAMRYNSGSGSNVRLYRYYYGTDGNIGYIEDVKNDVQWRYEYDQGGRITSAYSSLGEWHNYTYNSTIGELTKHTYMGNGSSTASSTQYSYEAYNNNGERLLTKITFNGGPLSLEYGYDSFYRGADKTAKILSGASIDTHYTYRFDGVSGAEHKRSSMPREIRQTVKNGSKTHSVSKEKTRERAITKTESPPLSIYRHNGTNPGNLVPTNNDVRFNSGLSFSTVPKPNSWKTTIEAVNSTKVLRAVVDGPTHVSVYPIGGTVADWRMIGSNSIWTQSLIMVSSKYR